MYFNRIFKNQGLKKKHKNQGQWLPCGVGKAGRWEQGAGKSGRDDINKNLVL